MGNNKSKEPAKVAAAPAKSKSQISTAQSSSEAKPSAVPSTFTPDPLQPLPEDVSNLLITGLGRSYMRIIDFTTGKSFGTIPKTGRTFAIAKLSNEKDLVICGHDDGSLKVWNFRTGNLVQTLTALRSSVNFIFTEGDMVISGCKNGIITIFEDYKKGKISKELIHPQNTSTAIKIDDVIITGSNDGIIRLWSWPDGNIIKQFSAHQRGVKFIKRLSSELIVSAAMDKSLKVWNLKTFECLQELTNDQLIYDAVLVPESDFLIFGAFSLKVWDYKNGKIINEIVAHGGKNTSFCLTKLPGNLVASGSIDKTVEVWDYVNPGGTLIQKIETLGDDKKMLTLSDGVYAAALLN